MQKEGDRIIAELNLRRLVEARDLLQKEIKTLLMWGLPKYDYRVDQLPATTEN